MGCGCKKRGDARAKDAEALGDKTAARILRATPRITDRIQRKVVAGARRVIRGKKKEES